MRSPSPTTLPIGLRGATVGARHAMPIFCEPKITPRLITHHQTQKPCHSERSEESAVSCFLIVTVLRSILDSNRKTPPFEPLKYLFTSSYETVILRSTERE